MKTKKEHKIGEVVNLNRKIVTGSSFFKNVKITKVESRLVYYYKGKDSCGNTRSFESSDIIEWE
jgi:hypothetical protein